jgi:CTP synthase (UTP-ammonia lyase)
LKFDPYINVDAGTMNPYQHGEVFVTEDGAETDLDLGHYERFLDVNLTALNNVTTGKIYSRVIKKEREGKYLGSTVPSLFPTGELKTKPTQHSVKELRSIGIQPDIILCRAKNKLPKSIREKIALFTDVEPEAVISGVDVNDIYAIPLYFEEEGLGDLVCNILGLEKRESDLRDWAEMVKCRRSFKGYGRAFGTWRIWSKRR